MKIRMRRPSTVRSLLGVLVAIVGGLSAPRVAMAQFDDSIPQEYTVPGQVLVRAANEEAVFGIVVKIRNVVNVDVNPVDYDQVGSNSSLWAIKIGLPLTTDEIADIRAILDDAEANDNDIGWIEPNLYVDVVGGQTGSLWVSGLGIDASGYREQFAIDALGIETAQARSSGRGVMVAILDTGIDPTHQAFGGRVSPYGQSLVAGFPTPWDAPSSDPTAGNALVGHGTFLAGLVGLVAPDASLLPVRVLDSEGVGTTAIAAAGIEYAVDAGAHVIVLAFGSPVQTLSLNTAIQYAIDNGAIVLAAAGNDGQLGCFYPGSNADVFTLVASDHQENFDPISSWCTNVDAAAPGSMRLVGGVPDPDASIIGPYPSAGGDQYRASRGTSFAVGFAAGIAALVRAQHPEWPAEGFPEGDTIADRIAARLTLGSVMVSVPAPVGERPRVDALASVVAGDFAPDPGDLDGDGCIDAADLGLLLADYQANPGVGVLHLSDVDGDHKVTSADIGLLLANWRNCGFNGRSGRR